MKDQVPRLIGGISRSTSPLVRRSFLLLLFAFAFLAQAAHAGPILYKLNQPSNSNDPSGTFIYDSDTNTLVDYDIKFDTNPAYGVAEFTPPATSILLATSTEFMFSDVTTSSGFTASNVPVTFNVTLSDLDVLFFQNNFSAGLSTDGTPLIGRLYSPSISYDSPLGGANGSVFSYFSEVGPVTTVPEPATVTMLAIGALGLLRKRHTQHR